MPYTHKLAAAPIRAARINKLNLRNNEDVKISNLQDASDNIPIQNKINLLENVRYMSLIGADDEDQMLFFTNNFTEEELQQPYVQNYINSMYDTAVEHMNSETPTLYDKRYSFPDVTVVGYAPLKLRTQYPILHEKGTLNMPIGHSSIIGYGFGSDLYKGTKEMSDEDYSLVFNNCSDETRRILEATFGKSAGFLGFTTPGDVRDFAIENGAYIPEWAKKKGYGDLVLYIPMNKERYDNLMRYKVNYEPPKQNTLTQKLIRRISPAADIIYRITE